jgi:DNA-binding transcriptional regulator YdaS (Cro superfamily)
LGRMSDDSAIRRERLNAYCLKQGWVSRKDPSTGSASELVTRLGRTHSFWSDRLRGLRQIGAELAREIEERLEMTKYHLDGDTGWPFTRSLQEAVSKLSRTDLAYAENALRAHLRMPPISIPSGEPSVEKGNGTHGKAA